MRFCEDRCLIPRRHLKELFEERTESVGTSTMVFLREEFKHYNIIFDSDIFSPREWEDNLAIDFKVMKNIILETYNPYQFDVIPLEVLGNIYEQYLGYTIRLTEHQVKYELKPDFRKANGVYYTPEYIVDYIVKNTVGKLLQELSPKKIKNLRILDPACGSGSFLIRAYEEMLNYYQNQKKQHKRLKKEQKEEFDVDYEKNKRRLTIHEKSEILRNHIFGVDIDEQAVEVTKLSLMLKMLEGEYGFVPGRAILPMLNKNIRCGNSLISGDTLELKKHFGDDWYKVKAFNWNEKFRKIMVDEGGFDVVIGNPPYIKTQMLQSSQATNIEFYNKNYNTSIKGSFDIYILFIERALQLLSKNGLMGYICPHKFFNSNYGVNIRKLISERKNIVKILDFGINQVFENATTYTCLLFLSKNYRKSFQYFKFKDDVSSLQDEVCKKVPFFEVNSKKSILDNWIFVEPWEDLFLSKLKNDKPTLKEITTNIFQGPISGADNVFIIKILNLGVEKCKCFSISLQEEFFIERKIIQPWVKGKFIKRYFIKKNDQYIIFPYDKNGNLIPEDVLYNQYPLAHQYLSKKDNKSILLNRESGKFKNIWWSYSRPQSLQQLEKIKILTPYNAFKSSFAFDENRDFIFSAGVSGAYGILLKENIKISYKYLLAILNSSLLERYLKTISTALRGGFYSYEKKYIKQLPVCLPNLTEKGLYDDIVTLVDVILDLNKKIQDAKGNEKEQIQQQIEKTDKEIDQMVYKLYGLTKEEIEIIESETIGK